MIYEKKTNSYDLDSEVDDSCANDFLADCEITVTITLHEYRELVASNARLSARVADLPAKIHNLEEENGALRIKYDAIVRQMAGKTE